MTGGLVSAAEEKANVLQALGVPRETGALLEAYAGLLVDWNNRMNLVAPSTIPHLWTRHIYDSAQLAPLIPAGARILADMGSGAGFPGMVLAILATAQGAPMEIHLIESIGKKARFLETVATTLGLSHVRVRCARVEDLGDLRADCVTARAVTALPALLKMAKPLLKQGGTCLFLKGEKASAELTEARKYWTFSMSQTPSQTDPSGVVLAIRDLLPQRHHDRSHRPAR